ncbi:hypothetical protein CRM22_005885 [Opisthorchis felineus]|uniref:tRNA (adenine(58)-N(1))-methyltransferase non-catalytic subunit TRM6 n=1 Tax=Opisthorchis felineus TaxID=147828 RepID=A0A4S2LVV6_OPIFE|nr:hypothetical protein CRM22_005885 [Opisthorchis felineus]
MLIKAHDFVIVRKDEYFRSIKLDPDKVETIDGSKVFLKNAIGFPYGTLFTISGNQIEPAGPSLDKMKELLVPNESSEGVVTSLKSTIAKDNRHIVDSADNQKLDYDDIRSLRSSGTSGNEILTELVKGNANFDKKTKFSQEKYVSRKRKRHLSLFTIEKPCTRILCELYSRLRRDKCLGLRFDTLCHILTYSNVHGGSKVLLAETCAGLLLGGVLERIGPADLGGSVIQFFHGTSPPRPEVNPLAASAYEKQVCAVSLLDVVPLLLGQGTSTELPNKDQPTEVNGIMPESDQTTGTAEQLVADPEVNSELIAAGITGPSSEKSRLSCSAASICDESVTLRRASRLAKKQTAYETLVGPNAILADALIVATRFHPVDMTLLLMQFLPVGRPVVVYSQFLQPLVDLYNAFKQRGGVTQLRLTDTWFRTIQVLPDRTHPEVTMLASGGYLLCAYTVEPRPNTEQLLRSGLISSTSLPESVS